VEGHFRIEDWFSTRGSAGFTLVDQDGKRYDVYTSDLFKYLKGHIMPLQLEETKKGSVRAWKPLGGVTNYE
jgi:hypothetical protein